MKSIETLEQAAEEVLARANDENGNPIYENTYQYAILKREWK